MPVQLHEGRRRTPYCHTILAAQNEHTLTCVSSRNEVVVYLRDTGSLCDMHTSRDNAGQFTCMQANPHATCHTPNSPYSCCCIGMAHCCGTNRLLWHASSLATLTIVIRDTYTNCVHQDLCSASAMSSVMLQEQSDRRRSLRM